MQIGNSSSSGFRVFDANIYRERCPVFKNDGILIQQFDVSPEAPVVAIAGGRSNKVTFLNIETGQQAAKPIEHPAVVYSARFSPDGSCIVSTCRDGQARILDWRSGKILTRALEHEGDVVDACFAHGGTSVITIGHDKLARIWNVETGQQICPPIFIGDGMRYLETDSQLNRALVSGRVPKVVLIELDRPKLAESTNMNELNLLAELVSHASIVNARAVRLTTEEWIERWNRFQETGIFKSHIKSLFPAHRN